MSKQEVGFLTCRIMALFAWFVALRALDNFVGALTFFAQPQPEGFPIFLYLAVTLFPMIAMVAAGVFLWRGAPGIGHRMVGGAEAGDEAPPSGDALMAIAFAAIGMLTVVESLPNLINAAIASFPLGDGAVTMVRSPFRLAVVGSIQLGVGLWLLLGSRGIVSLVHRLRTAGTATRSGDRD